MEFFNGYILGILTMLIVFYPVIKSIHGFEKIKYVEIEDSDLDFIDYPAEEEK